MATEQNKEVMDKEQEVKKEEVATEATRPEQYNFYNIAIKDGKIATINKNMVNRY